ncbi:MAG: hypothetical protein ACP5XB_18385 [Isosphaeraceae bacterium]
MTSLKVPTMGAAVVALVWGASASALSDGDFGKILDRYKAELKRSKASCSHIYATGSLTVEVASNGRARTNSKHEIKIIQDGARALLRESPLGGELRATPSGRSVEVKILDPPSLYAIASGKRDGPFYPRVIGSVNQEASRRVADSLAHYTESLLKAPFSLLDESILSLLGSSQVTVTSVSPETAPNGKQWRFSFSRRTTDEATGPTTGWWVVDPDNGWALVRYHCQTVRHRGTDSPIVQDGAWDGTVIYGTATDSRPQPARVELEQDVTTKQASYRLKETFAIDDYRYAEYPNRSEFSLDYYGLGDLAGTHHYNLRLALLLMAVSAVAMVIWMILKRKIRACTPKGQTPPKTWP